MGKDMDMEFWLSIIFILYSSQGNKYEGSWDHGEFEGMIIINLLGIS